MRMGGKEEGVVPAAREEAGMRLTQKAKVLAMRIAEETNFAREVEIIEMAF